MVYVLKKQFTPRVRLYKALKATYGIGMTKSRRLIARYGLRFSVKVGQVRRWKIRHLNRYVIYRYIVGSSLKRISQYIVKAHKTAGSYKGLRFRQGLPANGQRTRSNANTCRRGKAKNKRSYSVSMSKAKKR